jgi:penicillin V acylase-like amidase (Ntn superfamily)
MCTRILWSSGGEPGTGTVAVARTLDWMEDTHTVLSVRPRGVHRNSGVAAGGVSWTAQYASVVALLYRSLVGDGLNDAGLTANGLYLTEADYGERDLSRPGFRLGLILQYLLDSYATVDEAVTWFVEANPQLIPESIGTEAGTAHISLADSSGDSAVIEFLDGKTSVHHGTDTTVMTNSPAYDEQRAQSARYLGLGGELRLPGGPQSPERYVRAAVYRAGLPTTDSPREAVAMILSAARAAAVPYGVSEPGKPNVAATRWVTVADLTDRYYFFSSTLAPSVIWVRLDQVEFTEGATEMEFDPSADPDAAGDVTDRFITTG